MNLNLATNVLENAFDYAQTYSRSGGMLQEHLVNNCMAWEKRDLTGFCLRNGSKALFSRKYLVIPTPESEIFRTIVALGPYTCSERSDT